MPVAQVRCNVFKSVISNLFADICSLDSFDAGLFGEEKALASLFSLLRSLSSSDPDVTRLKMGTIICVCHMTSQGLSALALFVVLSLIATHTFYLKKKKPHTHTLLNMLMKFMPLLCVCSAKVAGGVPVGD
jgi:hypothetical protein